MPIGSVILAPEALASTVIFLRSDQSSFHHAFAGDGDNVRAATTPNSAAVRTFAVARRKPDLRARISLSPIVIRTHPKCGN